MTITIEEIHKLFTSLWDDLQTPESFPNNRPLLAHYTSIENLARIMEDDEIWFTNPLYMNDWEELRVGMIEGLTAFRENDAIKLACQSPKRYEIIQNAFNLLYQKFDTEHAFI